MIIRFSYDELKQILNALDTKILVIEYTDPSESIPYRNLYSRLIYELNKFERG